MASLKETRLKYECWLWPDKTIGKQESCRLRLEHNRLVNAWAKLMDAARELVSLSESGIFKGSSAHPSLEDSDAVAAARAVLAENEEGGAL